MLLNKFYNNLGSKNNQELLLFLETLKKEKNPLMKSSKKKLKLLIIREDFNFRTFKDLLINLFKEMEVPLEKVVKKLKK